MKAKEILRTAGSVLLAVAFFFILSRGFSFDLVISGLLAVAMYFGMYFLLKPSSKIGRVEVDELKGGEDSLKLMEEAEKDIRSMEKNLPLIRDEDAAKYVTGLTRTGRKILVYLTEHPDRIEGAHRFADYYLDMAEKLTGNYVRLQQMVSVGDLSADISGSGTSAQKAGSASAQDRGMSAAVASFGTAAAAGKAASPFGIEIEESSPESVLRKTKDALKVLNVAFGRQLSRLMQGDLMEVESEIQVLRDVMKMEGDA